MTLNELKTGASGTITAVGGKGVLRRRLLDMGLTPKTKVMVRKVAPMGDPIEIRLRGYELTIRREEAAKIQVEPETIEKNEKYDRTAHWKEKEKIQVEPEPPASAGKEGAAV